jgi:uncharacterized protein
VELLTSTPDDEYWTRELGWETARAERGVDVFTSNRHGEPRPVAGSMQSCLGAASHWSVYFAVDDLDAACARVSELDGEVGVGPTILPIGRFASIEGPHGGQCVLVEKPEGWGGNLVS